MRHNERALMPVLSDKKTRIESRRLGSIFRDLRLF
jgi:hypothetical protein